MKDKRNLSRNRVNASTQQFLDISEIKEDTVILRDGTLRSVLMVSSINFALKSEGEQGAIVSAYVSFLNNLSFPVQIVIQSRELNIDAYLSYLKEKENEQTNELLKIQTGEYIQYIKELISMSKIMNKRFYAVVPYNPATDQQKKFVAKFLDIFRPATIIRMKEEKFLKRKDELNRRVDSVMSGLTSIGLNAVQLDTQGLIELYYNSYNPATATNEKLPDVNELRLSR